MFQQIIISFSTILFFLIFRRMKAKPSARQTDRGAAKKKSKESEEHHPQLAGGEKFSIICHAIVIWVESHIHSLPSSVECCMFALWLCFPLGSSLPKSLYCMLGWVRNGMKSNGIFFLVNFLLTHDGMLSGYPAQPSFARNHSRGIVRVLILALVLLPNGRIEISVKRKRKLSAKTS